MSPKCSYPHEIEVSPVNYDQDWDELMESYWNAWRQPLQASGELTFPYLGTGTEAELHAKIEAKQRFLVLSRDNTDVYWYKGVHSATGRIVCGASFTHHRPHPVHARAAENSSRLPFQATWFALGSEKRRLSEEMYEQLLAWRRYVPTKPTYASTPPPVAPD